MVPPLEGYGILQNITVGHENVEASLDFHVLIGHPLKKLFLKGQKIGKLHVKLGEEVVSILISGINNPLLESPPEHELIEEVMAISSFKSLKSPKPKEKRRYIFRI